MEDSEIIAKLLPLFDAYTAPYKFQYQIWTGFLLLVRSILFLKIHHTIEIGTLMDQLPSAPTCAARVEGLPCLASAE